MINLTGKIEPEDMPLCPLCDQPIADNVEIGIFSAYEMIAIAHKSCMPKDQEGE